MKFNPFHKEVKILCNSLIVVMKMIFQLMIPKLIFHQLKEMKIKCKLDNFDSNFHFSSIRTKNVTDPQWCSMFWYTQIGKPSQKLAFLLISYCVREFCQRLFNPLSRRLFQLVIMTKSTSSHLDKKSGTL